MPPCAQRSYLPIYSYHRRFIYSQHHIASTLRTIHTHTAFTPRLQLCYEPERIVDARLK